MAGTDLEVPAIQTEQLRRVYRQRSTRWRPAAATEVTALDGVDLVVRPGEIHGLLGPNGAGKTTLCKILSTVLLPTSGAAQVLGRDVARETRAVRFLISVVFGGDRGIYARLTAMQNLRYWAALYGLPDRVAEQRADQLLRRLGLADRAGERVEGFSRGMVQRLHLARGLIAEPKVILLDEPTNGLDPIAARGLRELIREVCRDRTILLTTHDMAEAELLCDRVTLMDRGRVIVTESPRTLATWISRYERIDVDDMPAGLVTRVRALPEVGSVEVLATGTTRIETTQAGATSRILQLLGAADVSSVRTSMPSLEEVYLHLLAERGMAV